MTTTPGEPRWTLIASAHNLTIIALLVVCAMLASSTAAHGQQAPVGLGTADSFAVLAGSTITNTGPTTITGDVGLHPGDSVTGFDDVTLHGELHVADAVAEQAKVDLATAYDDAAGRGPASTVSTELGGQTLEGGVYDSASGTFEITGTLTLDAEGNPDTVWVFQTDSTLITAANSSVNLINGADACNVFWQVGSSATLGTGSDFVGTILALESTTLNTGATVEGRVLARNGAATLDTNTITNGACAESTDGGTDGGTDDTTDDGTTDGGTDDTTDDTTDDGTDDGGTDDTTDDTTDGGTDDTTDGITEDTTEDTAGDGTGDGTGGGTGDGTDGGTEGGDGDESVVQAPTRIDTGAGGTAPPADPPGPGVLLLAVVAVTAAAVMLRRRSATSGD